MHCEGYVKSEPIYERWEREKITKNVHSFLKDATADVEILKQQFTKTDYINSNGTIDKWKLPQSVESIEQNLDKQLEQYKNNILKKLEKANNDVGIKPTPLE